MLRGVKMITVMLADDHPLVRKGLKTLIESEPGLKVIGEASSGQDTIDTVQILDPDILVLDMNMPPLNGLEVAMNLTKNRSRTAVIILSMQGNNAYVEEAFRSGVKGYILKENMDQLIEAILTVHAGGLYRSSTVSEKALSAVK
jgi:two-component system response regulator NreC